MGTIEEMIKTINDNLIDKEKEYLLLGQANKLLADKGIISISEKYDQTLKKLLEGNKISHAYQAGTKSKQWRIPLSDEVKERENNIKRKPITKQINHTLCPRCGVKILVPKYKIGNYFLQCKKCGREFWNPIRQKNSFNNPEGFSLTKSQRNWIIGIAVVIVLVIIGNLVDDDSSNSSTSNLRYINTTTYAATSKSNFDEMFRYISVGDEQALSTLMYYGNVKTLYRGTDVYLVSPHMTYSIVRLKGSTQRLWVVKGHISKR